MLNLFRHELLSRWGAILSWGIGLSLFSALYIGIYPDVADEMSNLADLSIYQAMGIDLASFAGFIASVVVQIMPLILGVYVILMATGTLAGEEEDGTLEMIVALPLKRWQIVTMKTLSLLVAVLLIMVLLGAGSALVLYLTVESANITVDVTPIQLFTALLGVYPMMIALFGVGLFFGAFMPSRRLALVMMFSLYLVSYLMNSVAGLVPDLEWIDTFSIFAYINTTATVFTDGAAIADTAILLAIGIIFFGLALWSFQGRNITVGQWAWERGHIPSQS